MTSILRPGDVSVHPEPPIDAADFLSFFHAWNELFYARPQRVVECFVDDPVEIVREDARVFALGTQRGVRDELHRFACSNDRCAFRRREHIANEPEVRDERVRMHARLRRGTKRERIIFRREEDRRVEIWRFALGSWGSFYSAEAGLEVWCAGREDGAVCDAGADVLCGFCGGPQVPGFLKGDATWGSVEAVGGGVCGAGDAEDGVEDFYEFCVVRVCADDGVVGYAHVDG